MKKLLIATDCFLPRWDGIARFLNEIIPSLKEHFEITVLAPAFPGESHDMGVRVVRFPLYYFSLGDFTPAYATTRVIRKEVEAADIVFTQTIGPIGAKTIRIASKKKKPIVAYTHSLEWELVTHALAKYNMLRAVSERIVSRMLRQYYNSCDLLIVPSEETAGLLSTRGVTTKKEVIYMGVNTTKFSQGDKRAAKKKFGLSQFRVIGYSGRLAREKDLGTLLQAFKRISRTEENVKLLIVGGGIESIKKEFQDQRHVIVVGPQDNVIPYLQAMDIYVLPSLTETSSLATMEAMSCGVCCVVTKVGSMSKYIIDKENGMFFPKQNPTVLALKLKWLLKNEKIRSKIGEQARETIVKYFPWEQTAQKIKEQLLKL